MPATIADISERLILLTTAIQERANLERQWRDQDQKDREKREDRQYRITVLLILSVLALAGLRIAEVLKLVP